MKYTKPVITKLNQRQRQHFSLHERELELDQYVMDKMRTSLAVMDSQSIKMLKELFEKKSSIRDIVLKRIK